MDARTTTDEYTYQPLLLIHGIGGVSDTINRVINHMCMLWLSRGNIKVIVTSEVLDVLIKSVSITFHAVNVLSLYTSRTTHIVNLLLEP